MPGECPNCGAETIEETTGPRDASAFKRRYRCDHCAYTWTERTPDAPPEAHRPRTG